MYDLNVGHSILGRLAADEEKEEWLTHDEPFAIADEGPWPIELWKLLDYSSHAFQTTSLPIEVRLQMYRAAWQETKAWNASWWQMDTILETQYVDL